MKKHVLAFAVAFATLLSTAPASAQSPFANTGSYGTAGCGLGSVLFGNQPGFVQVLAHITNVAVFSNQVFAITTGTSNCGSPGTPQFAAAAFVESNREVLAKDIARGNGDTVEALSDVAGCKSATAVGRVLRSRYGEIFPSATVTNVEVSETVVAILRSDRALACTKLQVARKPATSAQPPQVATR